MSDALRVSAILVVHDGATWLPETVASLASQTRSIDQIIAVDTGSLDTSAKLLKNARIPSIALDRTTGFGSAVASAVATLPSAVDPKREWLWILHDDLAPTPTALEALLSALAQRPNAVMAGPKLLGWYERSHLLEVGVSIATNGARWTGLESDEFDQGQHDGVEEVLSVSTAGALIRRDVFEELGGFDQNLELFRDDVDFGWRVHVAGNSVICVSDATAFHAQAAANERRSVDVAGALLGRPHLLDRRNSAYVLLVNATWWLLPYLTIQIMGSALVRAMGYLLAKLPGYASDEILAVGTLFIHPGELITARKARKSQRLVSSRVVKRFIPSSSQQFRSNLIRGFESLREKLLRGKVEDSPLTDPISDDEDLLVPVKPLQWRSLILRPHVIAALCMVAFTVIWSRNRFGTIAGGALANAPQSATDLWRNYVASWHPVGLGTTSSMPAWTILIAIGSLIFLGNVHLFITVLFLVAPALFMWSAYYLLKRLTEHPRLALVLSGMYAISPVSLAAINAGRLGTMVALGLAPIAVRFTTDWTEIERVSWRRTYGFSLLFALLTAFSLTFWLGLLIFSIYGAILNYLEFHRSRQRGLLIERLLRRLAIIAIPLLSTFPNSFEAFAHPSRFLLEPGLSISGGTPLGVLLGNPGGPGSMPLWVLSPAVAVLFVALFSVTSARSIAEYSIITLSATILLSALAIAGHGNAAPTRVWVGTPLAFVTLGGVAAAAVMLDRVRERLVATHVNYRHISIAALGLVSAFYVITTVTWISSTVAQSPVQTHQTKVVPEFLGVNPYEKTVVLRERGSGADVALSFYVSRGRDISLGEADIAATADPVIDDAVRALVDGTGLQSSLVFAGQGIKNVFLKNPASADIARVIDGVGGFTRSSATNAGIVWKVTTTTGRLLFTNSAGVVTLLETDEEGTTALAPSAGTLTLLEKYDRGWQVIQAGQSLEKKINKNGVAEFLIPKAGEFTLVHDGTVHRGLISLQLVFFATFIILALPSGRRRRDMSDRAVA